MDYFKINYDKLRNLKEIKYYILVIIVIIIFVIFLIISFFIKVSKEVKYYGIINNGVLKINIESKLSDALKNNDTLEFNNEIIKYELIGFGEYQIVNDYIIQEANLKVENCYDNEVGEVTIHYKKIRLCKYILDLFK